MRFSTFIAALVLSFAQHANAQAEKPSPYVEAGIAAPSRIWTSDDYAKTAEILASKGVPLPRYSSKDGAELLDRITARENLLIYHDRSRPFAQRFADYGGFLGGLCSIDELYVTADFSTKAPKPEVASLLAYLLRAVATGQELSEEFAATGPKVANNKAVDGALAELKSGLMTVFDETLSGLLEDEITGADRMQVLKALSETLPTMKRAFTVDYKNVLRKKLEADRDRSEDAEDRRLHDAMIVELDS